MSLSDAKIRAIARPDKPVKMADGQGLFLLVTPAGGKLWRFKYRHLGKEKTLAIGAYPEVSLSKAREKLIEARKLLADGIDPSAAKVTAKREKIEAAEATFAKLAGRWFKKWQIDKGEETVRRVTRQLSYATDRLGDTPVSELRARNVARCIEDIEKASSSYVAARCLGLIVEVLGYGLARGEVEVNVALGLRKVLGPVRGGHRAAVVESSELGDVLRSVWSYGGLGISGEALKILPYLFCRPGELVEMKWADLVGMDGATPEWRYRAPKTDMEMVVPLASQVVEIIKGIKPLTGEGEMVFPIKVQTLARAMRILKLNDMQSSHGWRATARTILDEQLGFRPDWIEQQLGHRVRDVNGRAYNRTRHLDGRRGMMQAWADYLDGLRLGVEVERDNVVAMRR